MNKPLNKETNNHNIVVASYTSGSLFKHVFNVLMSLAGAAVVQFFVQSVDLLFLSWLGDSRIPAGLGYASTALFSTFPFAVGLAVGGGTLAGHYIGNNKTPEVKRLLKHVFIMTIIVCCISCLALFLFNKIYYYKILHGTKEIYPFYYDYVKIMLIYAPFMHINFVFTSFRNSIGDLKGTFQLTVIMSVLNAILDPIFIFVFHWGIVGAASASLIAIIVIVALGYLRFKYRFKIWGAFHYHKFFQDMKDISHYFLSNIFTAIAPVIFSIIMFRTGSAFGTEVISMMAIVSKVVQLTIGIVIFNIGTAVNAVVSQNVGAKRYDRVLKTLNASMIIVACYMIVTFLIFNLGGSRFIAWAFRADNYAKEYIIIYFNYIAEGWGFLGICFACLGCLNAMGKPFYCTVMNIIRMLLISIPMTYVFNLYVSDFFPIAGPMAPYFGQMTGGILTCVVSYILVRRTMHALKKKEQNRLLKEILEGK